MAGDHDAPARDDEGDGDIGGNGHGEKEEEKETEDVCGEADGSEEEGPEVATTVAFEGGQAEDNELDRVVPDHAGKSREDILLGLSDVAILKDGVIGKVMRGSSCGCGCG